MSDRDLFADYLEEEPKEEVKEIPEDVKEELVEDDKEHDDEYEEIKDTNDVPFLDRLSNVIDEHDQNKNEEFLDLDDSPECSSKFEEKENEEYKEDYSAFEREISEKDDEIRYLKTEISSLQNKIAEQNKTAEEMRKNKNVGFSEIVPSLEKIFNLIETRSNSKMLEFAQILVDEEKKSLQAKHDEDLLLISELKSENMILRNEIQRFTGIISDLESQIKDLEKHVEERVKENQRLFKDNALLSTKNDCLNQEIMELKYK